MAAIKLFDKIILTVYIICISELIRWYKKMAKLYTQQLLFQAVLKLKTEEDCKQFFGDLCTPTELEAISSRWRVAKLLTREVPYRKISEVTGVSTTTIGRAARFINGGSEVTKRLLNNEESSKTLKK